MRFPRKRPHILLLVITVIAAVLLASVFLFWGVHSLFNPFVPEELLAENTRVCAVLILTAAALIYALFRPYSGGFFLCIWAVPFGFILSAFRLSISKALYLSMEVVSPEGQPQKPSRKGLEGAQGHGARPATPRDCAQK